MRTVAPWGLGARQAISLLAEGRLSAEALTASCLERIQDLEPAVQAWETLDPQAALAQARAADQANRPGLLRGLPIAVKDVMATVDLPTSCGSPIYAGTVFPYDAAVVAQTRASGGVVMGKTVTTEFATYQPPKTRNPVDLTRTPGGSSSGSAAAVASGMVPVAFGTQTAGSIIRPASYCGVVGYKPSYGLIDPTGVKALASLFDTVGVFTRSVGDAAFIAQVLSGDELGADDDLAMPPRLGLCRSPAWTASASPALHAAWDSFAADVGFQAEAQDLALPASFNMAGLIHERLMAYQAARALSYERLAHADQLSPALRAMLEMGAGYPRSLYFSDWSMMRELQAAFAQITTKTPVILTPSAPDGAPLAEDGTGSPAFSRLWTLMGGPCISVPLLKTADGLPLGVQVVAAPGKDRLALSVAAWLEHTFSD